MRPPPKANSTTVGFCGGGDRARIHRLTQTFLKMKKFDYCRAQPCRRLMTETAKPYRSLSTDRNRLIPPSRPQSPPSEGNFSRNLSYLPPPLRFPQKFQC